MAIEIVDLPIKNCGSVHSYVAVYQRVYPHYIIIFFVYIPHDIVISHYIPHGYIHNQI